MRRALACITPVRQTGCPFGHGGISDHFEWLCSATFRDRLATATQPYYERLLSATRQNESQNTYSYLEGLARAQGFSGAFME